MHGFALLDALKDATRRLVTGCGSRGAAERHLRIEERLSLGPKKALLYVTCDGRSLLVAVGAEEIAGLCQLEAPNHRAEKGIPLLHWKDIEAEYRKQVS